MIFPLADQISVYKTLSNNSSQSLSKLLTSSAKCGLKGANVQKNRVADTAVKRLSMRETLRGDRRLHRSIRKGCGDGCILL